MAHDKTLLMEMLRRMMRIRFFEEQVLELVGRGELVGAIHTYIGEEAVAVERARVGRGPSLIEGKTFRYQDHSEGLRVRHPLLLHGCPPL